MSLSVGFRQVPPPPPSRRKPQTFCDQRLCPVLHQAPRAQDITFTPVPTNGLLSTSRPNLVYEQTLQGRDQTKATSSRKPP